MPGLVWLALVGCHGGRPHEDYPPVDEVAEIPCDVSGSDGLAVRVRARGRPRYDDGARPLLVRIVPPNRLGMDDVVDPGPAEAEGAAVVQFLDPGTSEGVAVSGGVYDAMGPSRLEAIGCVADWLADGAGDLALTGPIVLTGLSFGGDGTLLAAVDQDLPVDGVVLWESPLVDQLVTSEPSPNGVADPAFVPGSCTLDDGCPFPGRAAKLRYRAEHLYQDLDGDGIREDTDPDYSALPDATDATVGFWSREMWADVMADPAKVFGGPVPETFPDDAETDAFWAPRDATEALVRVRDQGDRRAFLYVATREDHVQQQHEHVRLAEEGLSGADFFRLDPDDAYVVALGGPEVQEWPAGTVVDDPVTLDEQLPELEDDTIILAGELELADRAWTSTWQDDLDAVIVPR